MVYQVTQRKRLALQREGRVPRSRRSCAAAFMSGSPTSSGPPRLQKVSTFALQGLRDLLPSIGGRDDSFGDDRSEAESSAPSIYHSAKGSSTASTPRVGLHREGREEPACIDEPSLESLELSALIAALESDSEPNVADSLSQLASIMDTSFGEAATSLCAALRAHDVVPRLVALLASPTAAVHQLALVLLGNLASSDVDPPGAKHTRRRLRETDGFLNILPHLDSADYMTQVYALGAVQNTCSEIEYVYAMQQLGAVARLQEFVASADVNLEPFARGCLANMRETILHAGAARRRNREAA